MRNEQSSESPNSIACECDTNDPVKALTRQDCSALTPQASAQMCSNAQMSSVLSQISKKETCRADNKEDKEDKEDVEEEEDIEEKEDKEEKGDKEEKEAKKDKEEKDVEDKEDKEEQDENSADSDSNLSRVVSSTGVKCRCRKPNERKEKEDNRSYRCYERNGRYAETAESEEMASENNSTVSYPGNTAKVFVVAKEAPNVSIFSFYRVNIRRLCFKENGYVQLLSF